MLTLISIKFLHRVLATLVQMFGVYVFMFMFPPTLSRIEMDKYLISREKSCQIEERKAAVVVSWPALPCMSLILTVLVFGQDWPGCCQSFRLSNLIFSKNSELVFFSLLCNSRLEIMIF